MYLSYDSEEYNGIWCKEKLIDNIVEGKLEHIYLLIYFILL